MPKTEKPIGKNLLRQKKLQIKILEERGKPLGAMMKAVGYSDAYAKNPQQLLESDNWKLLQEKFIPDKLLAKKHKQILNAEGIDKYIFPNSMTDKEMTAVVKRIKGAKIIRIQRNGAWARAYFIYPDFRVIKDGVELGYKVKGKFAPEEIKPHIAIVNIINYAQPTS